MRKNFKNLPFGERTYWTMAKFGALLSVAIISCGVIFNKVDKVKVTPATGGELYDNRREYFEEVGKAIVEKKIPEPASEIGTASFDLFYQLMDFIKNFF